MTQNQATTIIVLLAAILFVLIVGRNGALETMDNLWWVLAVIVVLVIVAGAVKGVISHLLTENRARKREKLDNEIEKLCREIAQYPGPQLTTNSIPARFPSKGAAQAFGEKWSRGGPDSFSVQAVDSNGRYEELPDFDKTSISGGIPFSYPALFFGMAEAHRDDDPWYLDYLRAQKKWLQDYSDHLRATAPVNRPHG